MTQWAPVWVEHQRNVGFVEGPNNRNPWTEEMGAGDASYCVAAATIIAHHNGVQWWPDSQFGVKGFAYVPYLVQKATKYGCWKFDHASVGLPCDLVPGDIVAFDWTHNGVADHAETVVSVYADGTYDTIGYNTGNPEGCHFPIRRDRKYLLGRSRMQGVFYTFNPTPGPSVPGGQMNPDFNPPVHLIGNIVSVYFPAGFSGCYAFTEAGYVYTFGDTPGYRGGPAATPAANWVAGRRVGARIEKSPIPGCVYRCWDTNSEAYDF